MPFPGFQTFAQGSAAHSSQNTGSAATSTIAVNQGDSVYVFVAYGNNAGSVSVKTSPSPGVTDSSGNVYQQVAIKQNTANPTYPSQEIWVTDDVSANPALTVTVGFTGSTFYVFTAVQVSGADGSGSPDTKSTGTAGNGSSSSDPITTNSPGDLVIACDCSVRGTGTVTSGGGFTYDTSLSGPSGPTVGSDVYLNLFYLDAAALGSYNSSLNYSTAKPYAVITVSVRQSSSWTGLSGKPFVTVSPYGIKNSRSHSPL
jgi:hypothetical protein